MYKCIKQTIDMDVTDLFSFIIAGSVYYYDSKVSCLCCFLFFFVWIYKKSFGFGFVSEILFQIFTTLYLIDLSNLIVL